MNIFQIFGVISINGSSAMKTLEKVGKAAMTCGKVIAKGIALGTAAVTTLSTKAYAEFEQLEGGVEKLFGAGGKSLEEYAESVGKSVEEASGEYNKLMAAQNAVFKNAKDAYKNAGLSANEYLNQTTRFSASLINGLGGDTEAAAEMANIAIEDMADNANTFGTDITRIQDAYQNFAKGQFMLLDNLSLGYGGSQEEMARLINDSGVMGKNFIATAENVKGISFAKIIEAIHVVQTEMGIAGTTAKEATGTISGSFAMWKASWQNLMTGLGDDENIDPLVDAFFDAGNKVLQNLAKVLPKIGKNLKAAMVSAGANIRKAMEQNIWPSIQRFAKVSFGIELPKWSDIETQVSTWWTDTSGKIQNLGGNISLLATQLLPDTTEFSNNIASAWSNVKLFASDMTTLLTSIVEWIANNEEAINLIKGALAAAAFAASPALAIFGLIVINWEAIKNVVIAAWDALKKFFSETIPEAWKNMVKDIKQWWNDNVKTPIDDAIMAVKEFLGMNADKTITVTVHYASSGKIHGGGVGQRFEDGEVTPKYDEPIGPALPGAESVEWRAAGAVFSKPTIFNTRLGLQGVGDSSTPEVVAPIGVLQGYVTDAVRSELGRMEAKYNSMVSLLQTIAQNTAARQQLALNNGVIAGELIPEIDAKLGQRTARKERRG